MGLPWLEESPLGGVLGAYTASIFALDPILGVMPIEPLLDIIPGVSPLRVTLDMVDGEKVTHEYSITTNAIGDIADTTSNVHRKLRHLTLEGTLSAALSDPPFLPIPLLAFLPNPLGLIRVDLIRIQNLRKMADERRPVMVVTPRYSMARAFIGNVSSNWDPAKGHSHSVSIDFHEAFLAQPTLGKSIAGDFKSLASGNGAASGGGVGGTSPAGSAPAPSPGGAPDAVSGGRL